MFVKYIYNQIVQVTHIFIGSSQPDLNIYFSDSETVYDIDKKEHFIIYSFLFKYIGNCVCANVILKKKIMRTTKGGRERRPTLCVYLLFIRHTYSAIYLFNLYCMIFHRKTAKNFSLLTTYEYNQFSFLQYGIKRLVKLTDIFTSENDENRIAHALNDLVFFDFVSWKFHITYWSSERAVHIAKVKTVS